jgi:hypothetical protein
LAKRDNVLGMLASFVVTALLTVFIVLVLASTVWFVYATCVYLYENSRKRKFPPR